MDATNPTTAAVPASPPQAPNLFAKYASLLADHLEVSLQEAGQMLLSGADHFTSLMCHLQSEMAIVKNYIISGEAKAAAAAAEAVTVTKAVQADANEVGSIVESIDPAATAQVEAAELAVGTVEKTAEVAEAALQNAAK